MRTWNSIVVAALFCLSFAAACESGAALELYLSAEGLTASEGAAGMTALEQREPVYLLNVQGTVNQAAFEVHAGQTTLIVEVESSANALKAEVKDAEGNVWTRATYAEEQKPDWEPKHKPAPATENFRGFSAAQAAAVTTKFKVEAEGAQIFRPAGDESAMGDKYNTIGDEEKPSFVGRGTANYRPLTIGGTKHQTKHDKADASGDPCDREGLLPAYDCGDGEDKGEQPSEAMTRAMVEPFFLEQLLTHIPQDGMLESGDICDVICCHCLRATAPQVEVPRTRIER